jgi:predicted acylesterase/phospholipase RssA
MKLGLALGRGGGRGAALTGVLSELDRLGVQPNEAKIISLLNQM